MRMRIGADWRPLPVPALLWLNTGVLVASSVALHRARSPRAADSMDGVRDGLLAGGVLALAFLAGQLLAWRQLDAAGYFLASQSRQFLLLPAHRACTGCMCSAASWPWARTTAKLWRGLDLEQVRLSVELCAIYWHFLLCLAVCSASVRGCCCVIT